MSGQVGSSPSRPSFIHINHVWHVLERRLRWLGRCDVDATAPSQYQCEQIARSGAPIAAIEGIRHTEKGAPLTLLGWPNEKEGRTDYAIQVPKAASLILAPGRSFDSPAYSL